MESDTYCGRTIVDPPGGWRYGFPAPLQDDYLQQLIDAGYPTSSMSDALNYSRYWEEERDDNTTAT